MRFYDYRLAPSPRKVRLFVAEKGLEIPTVEVSGRARGQQAPEFLAVNPGATVPVVAQLRVTENGGVFLNLGGHEMGQGIRTALANAVSRKLGVPPEKITAVIGDTRVAIADPCADRS